MQAFDMRTVALLALVSCAALAVGLQLVNRVIRNDPSVQRWTSGVTLAGVGVGLISLRGVIPDFVSIVIANSLIVSGFGQIYLGFRHHYDLPPVRRWDLIAAVATGAAVYVFSVVAPSLALRIVVMSVVLAAFSGASAFVLLRSTPARTAPDRQIPLFLGATFAAYGTYMVVRAIWALSVPVESDYPGTVAVVHTLIPVLAGTVLNVLLSMGFPLMIASRMQQKLGGSETKYQELVENANVIILHMSLDGKVIYFNEHAEKCFGFKADEIVGRHVLGTIVPETESATGRDLGALVREILAHPDRYEQNQNENVTKDGRRMMIQWTNKVVRDELGHSKSILCIGHDVTERYHYQEEIRRSAVYVRSLIEASLDPLVTISCHGKIEDVNKATEVATGLERTQLIGTDFSDYFTEPESARAGYEKVLAEGHVIDYPLALRHVDGTVTLVLYNASTYCNERGEVVGVFAAARDVTERETIQLELMKYHVNLEKMVESRTAELKAANQVKSRFLANMSHELRTPLNHIFGFTSLLQRDLTDARAKDRLAKVDGASKALLRLIDNLLVVSRIESGESHSIDDDFDLTAIVAKAFHDAYPKAVSKNMPLAIEIDSDTPRQIKGNSGAIMQTLDALLDNAVKFSECGKVMLCVTHKKHEDGLHIAFEVRDEGIGISEDQQGQLFQMFYQGDDSQTRKFGGTGIGLALAKGLVKLMGGEIGFSSTLGVGSTFWFHVPVQVSLSDASAEGDAGRLLSVPK